MSIEFKCTAHCYIDGGTLELEYIIYLVALAWQGYRVLVVEQTETPDQLEIRRKTEGSKDKVWSFRVFTWIGAIRYFAFLCSFPLVCDFEEVIEGNKAYRI